MGSETEKCLEYPLLNEANVCVKFFFVIIWTTFAYFQVKFNEKVYKGTVIIYQLGAVGGFFLGGGGIMC